MDLTTMSDAVWIVLLVLFVVYAIISIGILHAMWQQRKRRRTNPHTIDPVPGMWALSRKEETTMTTKRITIETTQTQVIQLKDNGEYLAVNDAYFDSSTPDVRDAHHFDMDDNNVARIARQRNGTVRKVTTRIEIEAAEA